MPSRQNATTQFSFPNDKSVNSRLLFDQVMKPEDAGYRERYEALARAVRDAITPRWIETEATYQRKNPKRIYYLSMEFLLGRMLVNNLINLGIDDLLRNSLSPEFLSDWEEIINAEPDAGLGNGGLGRLAACFIDSMATLGLPGMGYGLRYEYGIFSQQIQDGFQREQPDHWLNHPDPWEVKRPHESVVTHCQCSFQLDNGMVKPVKDNPISLIGIPYDRPVVGCGGKTINTLRLWSAASSDYFNFHQFSSGDFLGAILDRTVADTLTRVLYPDDSTNAGLALRFLQEHFLVTSSLADIIRRFRRKNDDWSQLPIHVAIQLNDTHPAMAVAELMRILLDDARLGWEQSWELTVNTLAYTNHTLLPEALEKWPTRLFELCCPRLLEIIFEINSRFLKQICDSGHGKSENVSTLSLIEEQPVQQVRMAHLAIVGSHSTNGVAKIHTELLKSNVVSELAEMFPKRFNNKTNGISPRRWLLAANPNLARLISDSIGQEWITDTDQLSQLRVLAEDSAFRTRFNECRQENKKSASKWLTQFTGQEINPDSLFDAQVKRIHEYKRQLLNAMHVAWLFYRMKEDSSFSIPPRTFLFAGKAAPAYRLAKLIIKLINTLGQRIDEDPVTRGKLKVIFIPDYKVSIAEKIIPACDLSEQISTAGFEASGTGNMKFMMNGALTIGTRDGATIEMAQEAGEENLFLFGLTADQVLSSRSWYNPRWHFENDPAVRVVLDLFQSEFFSPGEPDLFQPIIDALLTSGDYFMHLADFRSYIETQEKVSTLYSDQDEWTRKAILNVAASGRFSSDRTIREYASEIWNVPPCTVDE